MSLWLWVCTQFYTKYGQMPKLETSLSNRWSTSIFLSGWNTVFFCFWLLPVTISNSILKKISVVPDSNQILPVSKRLVFLLLLVNFLDFIWITWVTTMLTFCLRSDFHHNNINFRWYSPHPLCPRMTVKLEKGGNAPGLRLLGPHTDILNQAWEVIPGNLHFILLLCKLGFPLLAVAEKLV